METYQYSIKQNRQEQYNGDGILSGIYVSNDNVKVAAQNKSDTVRGTFLYEGFRDATDYDRINWTLVGDKPYVSDGRGALQGYAGGFVETRYLSTFGFHFRDVLSTEDSLLFENAKAAARQKCLQDSRGRPDRMQLGANLGEMRQTLGMFADNAAMGFKALKAAKTGRWGAIPEILGMRKKDIQSGRFGANRWLEYQYGWKPLFSDLHTGYQKLFKGSKQPMFVHFRGAQRYDVSRVLRDEEHFKGQQSGYVSARCHCVGKLVSETAFGLAQDGLLNPLSVAWELVPFSFVVDWFSPIGNALDGLTSTAGLDFVMGYEDWKVSLDNHHTYGYYPRSSLGSLEEKYHRFTRYRRTKFPGFELYADLNPLRGPRSLNALALFRGLFR